MPDDQQRQEQERQDAEQREERNAGLDATTTNDMTVIAEEGPVQDTGMTTTDDVDVPPGGNNPLQQPAERDEKQEDATVPSESGIQNVTTDDVEVQ